MILAVCGLSLLGAAGCDDSVETPEGFAEAGAGPLGFAHPEDWTETPEAESMSDATAQFLAPLDDADSPTGILVFSSPEEGRELDGRVQNAKASYPSTFPDFEVVEETDLEVPGAEGAVLLEFTYTTDADEDAHSFDVITGSEDEEVVFRVAGPEDALDEDLARRIIDTLSFD